MSRPPRYPFLEEHEEGIRNGCSHGNRRQMRLVEVATPAYEHLASTVSPQPYYQFFQKKKLFRVRVFSCAVEVDGSSEFLLT